MDAARPRRAAPRHRAAIVAALAPLLVACPKPSYDPPEDMLADAQAVLALTAGVGGPQTAAIEARATQYSDRGALKGSVVILVRRPDAVHFSALSPTDDLVSVLATDGRRFSSFEVGGDTCFVGDACADNVGRLVAIAMEAETLAGVLLGAPPVMDHRASRVTWDRELGAYRVALETGPDTIQRLWVRPGDGRVVRATISVSGRETVSLAYEDWRAVDGHTLPHTIKVEMARGDTDIELRYREVDVDLALDDAAFAVPCPEGAAVEELPCPADPPGAL